MKRAAILTDDGTVIAAQSIGSDEITVGEIVFNTSMTGYQEMITDPSYNSQIITFTNPHIGNTGTNYHDQESDKDGCAGVILRNYPTLDSSWRKEKSLIDFLRDRNIAALCSVDTRHLTSLLRKEGSLNGCLVPNIDKLDEAKKSFSINPILIKAASGAFEKISIYKVNNLNTLIKKLKEENFWIIGIDPLSSAS